MFDAGGGISLKLFAKSITSAFKGGMSRLVNGVFKSKMDVDKEEFNAKVKAGDYDISNEFANARHTLVSSLHVKKWLS